MSVFDGDGDGAAMTLAQIDEVSAALSHTDGITSDFVARIIATLRIGEKVCAALARLRTPQALSAALGTDLPEGVADVLLALTAWMDATGQVDMTKRTITFEARGEKYSLVTEWQLEQMRGETFSIVADNLRAQSRSEAHPHETDPYNAGISAAATAVETIGAYYIAKYQEALAKQPTDPSQSMG